jgi:hypothetical protein
MKATVLHHQHHLSSNHYRCNPCRRRRRSPSWTYYRQVISLMLFIRRVFRGFDDKGDSVASLSTPQQSFSAQLLMPPSSLQSVMDVFSSSDITDAIHCSVHGHIYRFNPCRKAVRGNVLPKWIPQVTKMRLFFIKVPNIPRLISNLAVPVFLSLYLS